LGEPVFVTFRLYNSLPPHRAFPPSNLTSGEAFATMDRLLDQARSGPIFLREPAIAQEVLRSIETGAELGHYRMHAWVIMPNHVHLLFTPCVNVSKLLGALKAASAKRANLLLRRTGQPFWQDESYDHLVRNGEEFRRIQRYIEYNRAPRRVETQRVRGPHQEVIGYAWIANERRSLATDCAEAS